MMSDIAHWHWWVIGFLMILIELVIPTAFFLIWVGAGAVVMGILTLILPSMSWDAQLFVFTLLFIFSFIGWRWFLKKFPPSEGDIGLNARSQRYIGRIFTLKAPIQDGRGSLMIDHVHWILYGPDAEIGEKIKVIGTDGVTLTVEKAVDDTAPTQQPQ